MSKIFLSHASADNAEALAIGHWLSTCGWADYFLDLSASHGLAPGERWREALATAADRCEAVICLLSPAWRESHWCDREFYLAKTLGKRIFAVLVKPTPMEDLPHEMTSEWQLCDLISGERREAFRVAHDPLVAETDVSFATAGLSRLRYGLQKAGLDPGSFPWPPKSNPKRAPYPGLRALEAEDAAVFFGREAYIVRALNELRKRRDLGTERLFVILGASGSGKSSFLRAGIWPRLERDDWNFLPLPVMRPERAALTGVNGLAACVESAFRELKSPKTRASIVQTLQRHDGLAALLTELQRLATGSADVNDQAPLPTVVVSIDQGEELFASDGRHEAELVLQAIASTLTSAPNVGAPGAPVRLPLVIIAIRSDTYELLQTDGMLSGVGSFLFDLPPLPPTEYKAAVEGPAMRSTEAGERLDIDPLLTEKLIEDAEGADALPLLAFTLERLYLNYRAAGRLQLADYEALGGVRGSIEAAVQAALDEPDRAPLIPADPERQSRLLRAAFVPWLARVDPETERKKRRVARWDELPRKAHPLLERLIEKRLLIRRAPKEEGPEDVALVEVAHEALLRQWPTLTVWLNEDALALKSLEVVEKAVTEWMKNRDKEGDGEAWLVHTGERLADAELLRRRSDFERQLGADGRAYLDACRARDVRVRAEREERLRQIQAERDRAEEERERAEIEAANARRAAEAAEKSRGQATARTRLAIGALVMVLLTSALTGLFYKQVRDSEVAAQLAKELAAQQAKLAVSSYLASASDRYLDKAADQSLLLALAALKVEPTVEARSALLTSLLENPKLRTLLHGSSQLNAVAVHPGGVLLATAGQDGKATLWNLTQATLDGAPLEHTDPVTAVAFDAAGRRMATATWSGEVLLWDVATRTRVFESVFRHQGRVNGLAFSPDGRLLASAGKDRTVRLWDVVTGQPAGQPLAEHDGEVTCLAFSPDGRTLGSGNVDGGIVLWDLSTRRATALKAHDFRVTSVAFDAVGALLASGSEDGSIVLWDVPGRRPPVELFSVRRQPVTAVAFSPVGAILAAGANDGTIEVWDVSRRDGAKSINTVVARRWEAVSGLAFGPTKDILVSSSVDGIAAVWDLAHENPIATTLEQHRAAINAVAFGGNQDQILAAGGRDGAIVLWDVAKRKPALPPLDSDGEVKALAFGRHGTILASGSIRGQVSLWDASTAKRLGERLEAHTGAVTAVALNLDGSTLASASEDRTVVIWDAVSRKPLVGPLRHKDWVRGMALSPDGRNLATAGNDGMVTLWDLASGNARFELSAQQKNAVTSVAFSDDGKRLAAGGFDQSVIVWDVDTGKQLLAPLVGHKGVITGVAFGGGLVASVSADGTAILWDLATGRQIGRNPLAVDGSHMTSVAFTQDGNLLATGAESGKVTLWNVSLDSWKDLACQVSNRNLSCVEWQQFLPTLPYAKLCEKLPAPPDHASCAEASGSTSTQRR